MIRLTEKIQVFHWLQIFRLLTETHAMPVLLAINGVEINCTQEELINVGLSLASGSMKFEELCRWLNDHN